MHNESQIYARQQILTATVNNPKAGWKAFCAYYEAPHQHEIFTFIAGENENGVSFLLQEAVFKTDERIHLTYAKFFQTLLDEMASMTIHMHRDLDIGMQIWRKHYKLATAADQMIPLQPILELAHEQKNSDAALEVITGHFKRLHLHRWHEKDKRKNAFALFSNELNRILEIAEQSDDLSLKARCYHASGQMEDHFSTFPLDLDSPLTNSEIALEDLLEQASVLNDLPLKARCQAALYNRRAHLADGKARRSWNGLLNTLEEAISCYEGSLNTNDLQTTLSVLNLFDEMSVLQPTHASAKETINKRNIYQQFKNTDPSVVGQALYRLYSSTRKAETNSVAINNFKAALEQMTRFAKLDSRRDYRPDLAVDTYMNNMFALDYQHGMPAVTHFAQHYSLR